MAEPVRHRQTKGAATDMFDLQPPRHTSTLPRADLGVGYQTAVQLASLTSYLTELAARSTAKN
jgi:hypothetical protein